MHSNVVPLLLTEDITSR